MIFLCPTCTVRTCSWVMICLSGYYPLTKTVGCTSISRPHGRISPRLPMGLTVFFRTFFVPWNLFLDSQWWNLKSHDNFFSSGRGVSNSHIHCRWHISCQEGREAQRIALEETRLGIPLIYGSDACWSFMGAFKVKVQNTTFLFFGEQYPHHICADLTYYTYYTEIILFVCPHVYICWIHFHVFSFAFFSHQPSPIFRTSSLCEPSILGYPTGKP